MATTPAAQGVAIAGTPITPTKIPVRKVQVGTLAGSSVTIIVYVLNTFMLKAPGQQIEAPVAAAITVLATFALSYLTPPNSDDMPSAAAQA